MKISAPPFNDETIGIDYRSNRHFGAHVRSQNGPRFVTQTSPPFTASDYIGRQRFDCDEISAPRCRMLAALLDLNPASVRNGDELPLGWSAILFPTIARQSELGADGHSKQGEFLPPPPLPRRMFAGREVTIHQALRIGQAVDRTSTIEAITPKTGRRGALVFVTIRHDISGSTGIALTERQNVVYREEGARTGENIPPELPTEAWAESFVADSVSLFRYSALTYNTHRIHYDQPYATGTEGYPALVVNGGLTTLRLLEMFRARTSRTVLSYAVRALHPLYGNRTSTLKGAPTPDGAVLWASDEEGRTAMKIDVRAAP